MSLVTLFTLLGAALGLLLGLLAVVAVQAEAPMPRPWRAALLSVPLGMGFGASAGLMIGLIAWGLQALQGLS